VQSNGSSALSMKADLLHHGRFLHCRRITFAYVAYHSNFALLGRLCQPLEPPRQSLHVLKTVKSPECERPNESEAFSQAPVEAQKTSSWLESMPAVSPCAGDRLKFCKDVKGTPEDVRACLMHTKTD